MASESSKNSNLKVQKNKRTTIESMLRTFIKKLKVRRIIDLQKNYEYLIIQIGSVAFIRIKIKGNIFLDSAFFFN